MRKLAILFFAGTCLGFANARAVDLKESKFTQVVNDVQVVSTSDNSKHAATVDALFKLPDVVRTGPASRAELVAEDHTITRIGANTIFSFDQASRTIRLDQGSLLFNSPKGKGGGSIHTTAATAAVLGTTIIVTTTADGGFKVLVLEGKAEVKFLNGVNRSLKAGQMVFVLPGGLPGPVVVFRLDQQVGGSQLVNGFASLLPTLPLINQEVTHQLHLIQTGRAADTGLLVGNVATPTSVQTVQLFGEINASPGANNGVISGLTTNGPGAGLGTTFTLPPGFVVPPGLAFDPATGGFLTTDGLLFIPGNSTNGVAPPAGSASIPALASLSDSTVTTTPNLDPSHFFSDPVGVINTLSGRSTGFAAGYIARNLFFNSANLNLAGLGQSQFSFVAAQTMTFSGNSQISGSPQFLSLDAGSGFVFNSDSSLTVDSEFFTIGQFDSLTLDNANISDIFSAGTILIDPTASLTLNNSFISAPNIDLSAGSSINLTGTSLTGNSVSGNFVSLVAGTSVSLSDSPISGEAVVFTGDTINLTGKTAGSGAINSLQVGAISASGMTVGVNVTAGQQGQPGTILLQNTAGLLTVNNGAHFTTDTLTVNSPGGILFDTTTVTANSSATFVAGNLPGNTITMQNTSFVGLGNINITARTVILNTVDFDANATTTISSFNHALAPNPNTGASIVDGDVNFVTGVTVGGKDAVPLTGGPGSGKPIIIN